MRRIRAGADPGRGLPRLAHPAPRVPGRSRLRQDGAISLRYEIARLLVRLGVAGAAAVVLALLWALLRGGPFRESLQAGLYAVGALCILLAAVGGSPSRRDASGASWATRWANADTFGVNRDNPPDRTLGPVVVLGAVGVLLCVLAAAIG